MLSVHHNFSYNQVMPFGYEIMMIILSLLIGLIHGTFAQGIIKDYCVEETFNVTCPRDHVILMSHAKYGRMRIGRCITGEGGQVGCFSNVIESFDLKCSGRPSCSMPVRDLIDMKACNKDFQSYLEASYECIIVHKTSAESCTRHKSISIHGPKGYILFSHNIRNLNQGRQWPGEQSCPWEIEVESGKHINITLMKLDKKGHYCRGNLHISDGDKVFEYSICQHGINPRMSDIYGSRGSKVSMYVSDMSYTQSSFLLKYKAVGCPDMAVPPNAFAERHGKNSLKVKCNFTDEIWFLTCSNDEWIGDIGNCTLGSHVNIVAPAGGGMSHYIQHGIVFAVLIGIVLGVGIGALLLLGVHCYKHKRSRANSRKANFVMVPQDIKDKYYEDGTYTTSMAPAPKDGQMRDPYPALLRDSEIYDTNVSRSIPIIRNTTSTTAGAPTPAQCYAVDNHNIHIKSFPHDRSMYNSTSEQPCKECVCVGTPNNKGTKSRCETLPASRYIDVPAVDLQQQQVVQQLQQQQQPQLQQQKEKCIAF